MKSSWQRTALGCAVAGAFLLTACGGGNAPLSASPESPAAPALETAAAATAAPEAAAPMKWHPGHYVVFGSDEGLAAVSAGLEETRNLPFVKGIVVRSYWRQLEPAKDKYAYWRIDRFLNKAASENKRFFVLLATRALTPGKGAPDYIKTPQYDGGVFAVKNVKDGDSENITLWDDDTRNRLVKLVRAIGARYNGNPWFEGVILSESAMGVPVEPVSDEKKAAFYRNLRRVDDAARRAFPNTVVIRFANYPKDETPAIVANLLRDGNGWGAPDVFLEDASADKFVYPFADQVRGQIPIGMQVEPDSYHRRSSKGPWDPPDVNDLYAFGRDRLHSNYMFWVRDLKGNLRPWEKVLAMFNSPTFPATPTGGLDPTCPSKYTAGCVE